MVGFDYKFYTKKANKTRHVPHRDRVVTFWNVLFYVVLVLGGMLAGIALCKLCPPFWNWLNNGWMESPWIPRAMFTVGAVCITAARCM